MYRDDQASKTPEASNPLPRPGHSKENVCIHADDEYHNHIRHLAELEAEYNRLMTLYDFLQNEDWQEALVLMNRLRAGESTEALSQEIRNRTS